MHDFARKITSNIALNIANGLFSNAIMKLKRKMLYEWYKFDVHGNVGSLLHFKLLEEDRSKKIKSPSLYYFILLRNIKYIIDL